MDDGTDLLVKKQYDNLRGRLCGLIESFGLDERQERILIRALKSLTYDYEATMKDALRKIEQ